MAAAEGTPQDTSADASNSGQQLGEVLSRVSRQLQEDHGDIEATLQAITTAAVHTVPNAEAARADWLRTEGGSTPVRYLG
jgi:hypothetical protein